MLTITGLTMVPMTLAGLIGLVLDPRMITGSPAWLKPTKFAVSILIYTLTLAWIYGRARLLSRWQQTLGSVVAWAFLIEQAIIVLQAARGTTSHFNISSSLNAALFATMGISIAILLIATILITIEVWRQTFEDPACKWALRLAMAISVAGASMGGLMVRPTSDQLLDATKTHHMPIVGAHSIGAVDGTAELAVIHWNASAGDLRVPHFLGLHALQALPLFLLLLNRLRPTMLNLIRTHLVLLFAFSYSGLIAILLLQAFRGLPVTAVDAPVATALLVWTLITAALALLVGSKRHVARLQAQPV